MRTTRPAVDVDPSVGLNGQVIHQPFFPSPPYRKEGSTPDEEKFIQRIEGAVLGKMGLLPVQIDSSLPSGLGLVIPIQPVQKGVHPVRGCPSRLRSRFHLFFFFRFKFPYESRIPLGLNLAFSSRIRPLKDPRERSAKQGPGPEMSPSLVRPS
jgi:hypothetical protein